MSALDDIEAAAAALNNLTAQEAAEKARIDAAVAAALGAFANPQKTVYLDAVAGLDTNDGSTPALAMQTLNKALSLIGAGQYGTVMLQSDVTVTAPIAFVGTALVTSPGVAPDGSAPIKRKVTFAPSAVTANPAPSANYAIYHAVGTSLIFIGVNVALGPVTTATGVFGTTYRLEFWHGSISFDPASTSPLIAAGIGASVWFIDMALPANYGGRIFQGIPAGANPNSTALRTNLLAA